MRCNDLWVAKSTDSLTFIYLFSITQVKREVGIEELVAISINNVPGSYIPKMSKTTLKNNHKKKKEGHSAFSSYKISSKLQIKNET